MRKYLFAFAGTVAGGLLLLGGAPAYADVQPAPATGGGGLLGGVLNPAGGIDPTGGLNLENPLGGDAVKVKPGANSPDLTGAVGDLTQQGAPAARTGLGSSSPDSALPAADVVKEQLPVPLPATNGLPVGQLPVGQLPVGGLLGGGLPLVGGLSPDGRAPMSPATEAGLLDGGLPLLGGLGGLLPADQARTLPAFDDPSDTSGLPAGGTDVPASKPADTGKPAKADKPSTTTRPADTPDAAGPGDDQQRLAEEPVDNEAQTKRAFSTGRPVAGVDGDYR